MKHYFVFIITSEDGEELVSLHPNFKEAISMQKQLLFDLQKKTLLQRKASPNKYRFVKPLYAACFAASQITFEQMVRRFKGGKNNEL